MRKSNQETSKHVHVTQGMINQLLELKKKTGVGYHVLYKYGKDNTEHKVFTETTDTLPNMWVIGRVKKVNIEYFNSIIETYKNIPECRKSGCKLNNIEVTNELRSALKCFVDKPRNLSLKKIIQYTNSPDKMTPTTISNIVNGKTSRISQEHFDYLENLVLGTT